AIFGPGEFSQLRCLLPATVHTIMRMSNTVMTSDGELLKQYVKFDDREALGKLVLQYVDFVYTAALRQVHDYHLAQDVAQVVFIILAQRAHRIRRSTSLASWLFTTTRFASANALRMEMRRRHRERRAARPEVAPKALPPSDEV